MNRVAEAQRRRAERERRIVAIALPWRAWIEIRRQLDYERWRATRLPLPHPASWAARRARAFASAIDAIDRAAPR